MLDKKTKKPKKNKKIKKPKIFFIVFFERNLLKNGNR